MKITAEIVNGKCPTCNEFTMLVGLTKQIYRCMNCGADLEQHVNGKISYSYERKNYNNKNKRNISTTILNLVVGVKYNETTMEILRCKYTTVSS
jgi:DNA-directed RNA polymerase subunit M/transcription elongation factor TFIIS